jgi:hypothetical protein
MAPRVCIDRVLPQDVRRPQRTLRSGSMLRAVFEFHKMWVNGSTLRVRFLGGTAAEQALVREQAGWWTPHANIGFVFTDAPDAEVRIAFDPNDGAWSYVGTDCSQIARGDPTMNLGFLDGGTAGHEFGHTLGLGHEHQNPQGGLRWNEAVVIRDLSGPPNYWSEAEIRFNVLEKYAVNQIRGTAFDPESIMLYWFPDSWVLDGHGTEENTVLSAVDQAFIASRDAYPRVAAPPGPVEPPPPVEPPVPVEPVATTLVLDAAPTKASIGQPGEEDLFRFVVEQGGRYAVRTGGRTDVVMKLFGPDSRTALIAEDDDSGVDLNARIVADLAPGEYFAQVRHYNPERASGNYTVRVNRK